MSVTRSPDAVIAAWFDEGPMSLPAETRRAITAALPGARRAGGRGAARSRFGWMVPRRAALATVSIAAAVTVAVVVFGGRSSGPVATPSATPAPSATPDRTTPSRPSVDTSGWGTFTSDVNGISFGVPDNWTVQAATDWWTSTSRPSPWQLDQAISPRALGFLVASQQVGDGLADATWWQPGGGGAHVAGLACVPEPVSRYVSITVAGIPAHELTSDWCDVVIAVAGDRVYLIEAWAVVEKLALGSVDTALFEAWLTTVHFEPARAGSARP
jgi:hypothetical protein